MLPYERFDNMIRISKLVNIGPDFTENRIFLWELIFKCIHLH